MACLLRFGGFEKTIITFICTFEITENKLLFLILKKNKNGCLLYLVYDIIDFEITENSSCTFVGLISFCFVFKLVRIVFFFF